MTGALFADGSPVPVASSRLKQQNTHKRTNPIKARLLGHFSCRKKFLKHRIQVPRMKIGTGLRASAFSTYAEPSWGNATLRKRHNSYLGSNENVGPAHLLCLQLWHVNLISGKLGSAKSTIPSSTKRHRELQLFFP